MVRLKSKTLVVLALSIFAGACGNDNPVNPTPPAPIRVTETFTGPLNINGAATYPFLVTTPGQIDLTIVNLDPFPEGSRVGLYLGTWNGTGCTVQVPNDNAFISTIVTGGATGSGFLCARIYDVGKISGTTQFEIRIEHP
jgi:hypothetical protein